MDVVAYSITSSALRAVTAALHAMPPEVPGVITALKSREGVTVEQSLILAAAGSVGMRVPVPCGKWLVHLRQLVLPKLLIAIGRCERPVTRSVMMPSQVSTTEVAGIHSRWSPSATLPVAILPPDSMPRVAPILSPVLQSATAPSRLHLKLPANQLLSPCLIGIEACASSHHWSRELGALEHIVRLMPAAYVKPYVKRQKNDAADAEAICEAVTRANMRFVVTKTLEQQSCLMLHRTRQLFIRQQMRGANRRIPTRHDDIHARLHQFDRMLLELLGGEAIASLIAHEVLPFDEAEPP
jgi:hypothetical protein